MSVWVVRRYACYRARSGDLVDGSNGAEAWLKVLSSPSGLNPDSGDGPGNTVGRSSGLAGGTWLGHLAPGNAVSLPGLSRRRVLPVGMRFVGSKEIVGDADWVDSMTIEQVVFGVRRLWTRLVESSRPSGDVSVEDIEPVQLVGGTAVDITGDDLGSSGRAVVGDWDACQEPSHLIDDDQVFLPERDAGGAERVAGAVRNRGVG